MVCNLLQIFGEGGFGKLLDAVVVGLGAADHALPPPFLDQALADLRAVAVEAIERARGDIEVELRPVLGQCLAEPVEHLDGKTAGVAGLLHHDWRNCADENQLCDRSGFGACSIMRSFAAAGRSEEHTSELQSLMRISYDVF